MTSEVPNKRRKSERAKPEFKPGEFINYTLSESDRGRLREWAASPNVQLGDFIDKVTDDGYQLSVRYDDFSGAYAAFLTPRDSGNGNAGFILAGRGRSGTAAIFGVLFRHYVLFEGQWPSETVRRNVLDDD